LILIIFTAKLCILFEIKKYVRKGAFQIVVFFCIIQKKYICTNKISKEDSLSIADSYYAEFEHLTLLKKTKECL